MKTLKDYQVGLIQSRYTCFEGIKYNKQLFEVLFYKYSANDYYYWATGKSFIFTIGLNAWFISRTWFLQQLKKHGNKKTRQAIGV